MKHVSKFDSCVYEISYSMCMENGKTYDDDITLIWRDAPCGVETAWDNGIPCRDIIGWYAGEYDYENTEWYIKKYWEKKLENKPEKAVEKKQKVVADLPICFVNMIAACLTTIQEHDLLDLVYGTYADKDDREAQRDDLETVLREFCDVLQEADEDTIIVKK